MMSSKQHGFTITSFPERGEVTVDSMGLVRLVSPVSGITITTTDARAIIRDPISGAHLRINGGQVEVVNPAEYQRLNRSSRFFVHKEPEVTMQTIRKTKHVSRYTNEKVGTAGTPTGIDPGLMIVKAVASTTTSRRPSAVPNSARLSARLSAPASRGAAGGATGDPAVSRASPSPHPEGDGHVTREFEASARSSDRASAPPAYPGQESASADEAGGVAPGEGDGLAAGAGVGQEGDGRPQLEAVEEGAEEIGGGDSGDVDGEEDAGMAAGEGEGEGEAGEEEGNGGEREQENDGDREEGGEAEVVGDEAEGAEGEAEGAGDDAEGAEGETEAAGEAEASVGEGGGSRGSSGGRRGSGRGCPRDTG